MFRQIDKINKEKEELNKIAQLPANRKLKYLALFLISIGIALFLIMIIWYDDFSREALLVMRGSAGLFAIFFTIIITIYLYRINSAHHKQRFRTNKAHRDNEKD